MGLSHRSRRGRGVALDPLWDLQQVPVQAGSWGLWGPWDIQGVATEVVQAQPPGKELKTEHDPAGGRDKHLPEPSWILGGGSSFHVG